MLYDMKDEQWERIKDSLPGKEGDSGRSEKDNRRFIAAVRKSRSTMKSALPAEYEKWSRGFVRAGVWQMIFNVLVIDEDTEWLYGPRE
jgi:hypothetical protein